VVLTSWSEEGLDVGHQFLVVLFGVDLRCLHANRLQAILILDTSQTDKLLHRLRMTDIEKDDEHRQTKNKLMDNVSRNCNTLVIIYKMLQLYSNS